MFRRSLTRLSSYIDKTTWRRTETSYSNGHTRGLRTTSVMPALFNVQDEEDFTDRVLKSSTPVVVDFHAQWCGPCKLLGPRLETIIGGKGDKVHLAKVDIDDVSDLALDYGVSAVPSVLAVKDGKVVDKFVGLQEESRIEAFVNRLIGE
ncbi:thioredoxin, mitochondrial-like [Homarus americanus]|uniref:Thioredoxin-like 2 n=1 Tax=Homarus americanus TaxID=6706 RepID=A0A8J5MK84_HOMAM|nr:thioredoxin, mitochondrial-like [Homarus americanus]KAG7154489.1 Thioredoxin-like 2 [Homarus americanus]